MNDEPIAFIDYWHDVDEALMRLFVIDTSDAGIEPGPIAEAQDANETPEEFALWFGEKYGLINLEDWRVQHVGRDSTGRTHKIATLNDLCRKAMGVGGQLVQTSGITALPFSEQSAIREKVETFTDFSPDNDPHLEHDFGAFEHDGCRIFWKIDYYDPTMTWGSEDPTDSQQTVRVLTIMFASEY